ncbi:helix-turn-helix domain-containing protein [Glutamicibacter ardleyensis]|uniref:helix-turn-helix domain-containing protein n=2 Tax=Glutamicibacter ardleyensis TaxID=225894 RepID=UPI003F8DEF62
MKMHGIIRKTSDLGLMVLAVRQRHGLSQVELAERLGVSQRYLSELETGKPKVLNARLLEVLSALGIELSFREAL